MKKRKDDRNVDLNIAQFCLPLLESKDQHGDDDDHDGMLSHVNFDLYDLVVCKVCNDDLRQIRLLHITIIIMSIKLQYEEKHQ